MVKRGRFIQAGLPAPRQLILDKGKDLNEYNNLTKGGTMKRIVFIVLAICLCLAVASCNSPFSPETKKANLVLDGDLVKVMTSYDSPEFDGYVKNIGDNTAYNCMVAITCFSDTGKTTIIDTANGFPANGGDIPVGTRAFFDAVAFNCTSHDQIQATTVKITWLDR